MLSLRLARAGAVTRRLVTRSSSSGARAAYADRLLGQARTSKAELIITWANRMLGGAVVLGGAYGAYSLADALGWLDLSRFGGSTTQGPVMTPEAAATPSDPRVFFSIEIGGRPACGMPHEPRPLAMHSFPPPTAKASD